MEQIMQWWAENMPDVYVTMMVTTVVAAIVYFAMMQPSISASHILTKTDSEMQCIAREITKRVQGGEPLPRVFAELAAKHSLCPSGTSGGGSLGSFGLGAMDPIFEKACLETPVGKVSAPFATGFGSHIIVVHSRSNC